jgi:hypothetical protein
MADDDSRFCKAAKEYIPMLGRPSWCPIIGALPEQHGRLVDADDVNNHIIGYVDLRDCPTIVPATERSETKGNATTPNTKWESITIKIGDKASDFWT